MKTSVLIRNGKQERPMLSVLIRYGIGSIDKYGRGRWINPMDLSKIEDNMLADPTCTVGSANMWVQGTCIHNQVSFMDFKFKIHEDKLLEISSSLSLLLGKKFTPYDAYRICITGTALDPMDPEIGVECIKDALNEKKEKIMEVYHSGNY